MLTAQQLTEQSERNEMNEACLTGKEDHWTMAAILPATTGVELAREALKAMTRDFGQLKDGTLLWC